MKKKYISGADILQFNTCLLVKPVYQNAPCFPSGRICNHDWSKDFQSLDFLRGYITCALCFTEKSVLKGVQLQKTLIFTITTSKKNLSTAYDYKAAATGSIHLSLCTFCLRLGIRSVGNFG